MSENTAAQIEAVAISTAIAKNSIESVGVSIQSPEITIYSFSEFTKPTFSLDTFEPGDIGSVFGSRGPDELSDPIRSHQAVEPLNPFDISSATEDFFSPIDEQLPQPGTLPTPQEAVDAVEQLLGKTRDKNIKDRPLKIHTMSEILTKTQSLKENPITKQIEITQPLVQNEIALSNIQTIETVAEEAIVQNPIVDRAVRALTIEAPHAEATVKALLEVGIKNAPEIVSSALTKNLAKENIQAKVSVQPQTKPFFSPHQEESFTFKLEFLEDERKTPQQLYVVDTGAREAQRAAFDEAIDIAVTENKKQGIGKVSGKDVLGQFAKREQQKSQPLENTLIDDGALAETTLEARNFLPNLGSNLKKYFHELIQTKPPIREDVQGKPVDPEDIARVFNGKKVISKNS